MTTASTRPTWAKPHPQCTIRMWHTGHCRTSLTTRHTWTMACTSITRAITLPPCPITSWAPWQTSTSGIRMPSTGEYLAVQPGLLHRQRTSEGCRQRPRPQPPTERFLSPPDEYLTLFVRWCLLRDVRLCFYVYRVNYGRRTKNRLLVYRECSLSEIR